MRSSTATQLTFSLNLTPFLHNPRNTAPGANPTKSKTIPLAQHAEVERWGPRFSGASPLRLVGHCTGVLAGRAKMIGVIITVLRRLIQCPALRLSTYLHYVTYLLGVLLPHLLKLCYFARRGCTKHDIIGSERAVGKAPTYHKCRVRCVKCKTSSCAGSGCPSKCLLKAREMRRNARKRGTLGWCA